MNNPNHEDTFAYWAAQLILTFAKEHNLFTLKDADDRIRALQESQAAGTFLFSSTPVLTVAVAAG